jgi:hypothetical protein
MALDPLVGVDDLDNSTWHARVDHRIDEIWVSIEVRFGLQTEMLLRAG